MSKRNSGVAVLAHSGGPTQVLNASLLGVIEEASAHSEITALYGARFGIAGILTEDFIDLFRQPKELLGAVAHVPSSALGTSRREVAPADFDQAFKVFAAHNVRYLFYNGGNGSMGTAHEIHRLACECGYELQVVGIPKTIDNDIVETDHTPGYASAARFFACASRDIGADNHALPGQVEIIEVLGRNVGWVAAATSLARVASDDAPHLIYLPEQRLPLEKFLSDIEFVYRRLHRCVVAVCEGQLDENGEAFGADLRSSSRGSLAMNLAHRLARLVSEHLKLRARSEKPGLLGRASADFVSNVDWDEARLCGRAAVQAAVSGFAGKMVSLMRGDRSTYTVTTRLVDLKNVAFSERPFPQEWQNAQANDILPAFREYALPLVGPISTHQRLDPILIEKRLVDGAV